jgi:hypothetical protein
MSIFSKLKNYDDDDNDDMSPIKVVCPVTPPHEEGFDYMIVYVDPIMTKNCDREKSFQWQWRNKDHF